MDIKELMRTYVFLNDPNVKQVTTKFGALVLGLGLATLAVWGAVNLAEEDAVQAPEAATGQQEETDTAADASTTTDCVPEAEEEAWRQEHQDLILANRIEDVERQGGEVCFTYTT